MGTHQTMEGVIILSNNKPLLASHFSHARIADLAIDAFLSAKRATSSSSSGSSGSRPTSVPSVLWYESFEGPGRGQASGSVKGKGTDRSTGCRASSSEDDDESEDSSDEDEEDEDEDGLPVRRATYKSISSNSNDIDPWAPSTSKAGAGREAADATASRYSASAGSAYACCHIEHNKLHFLVPISRECDPAVAFAYLYSLLGVLRNYLNDDVTDGALRDNFDVVLQLLEETFARPYPVSTDASALQELVPSSNIFNKILTAGLAAASQSTGSGGMAGVSNLIQGGGSSLGPSSPFSSQLHWRRAGIRHAQNEIYFDVKEELTAVVDKNGNVVTGSVFGRIDCRSKLSGMPDITLSFTNPSMLEDLSFHPCVRLGKWVTSKILSFVPPDGEFELMGYRLGNQTGTLRKSAASTSAASSSPDVPLPIRVRPIVTVGEVGGSFSISLSPPNTFTPGGVTRLEDVLVTLNLGTNVHGVTASISSAFNSNGSGTSSTMRQSSSNGSSSAGPPSGTWEFDSLTGTLKWRIPKFSAAGNNAPTLRGTWNFEDPALKSNSRPAPSVLVTFKAALTNISGLGITNLKVEGEKYSVYKGLRSHLTGSMEVRW